MTARECLDRDPPLTELLGAGEAVLANLLCAVRQRHLERHVLTGTGRRQGTTVRGPQHEGHRVGRLLQTTAQDQGAPYVTIGDPRVGVQTLLDRDQRSRHVPVHLVPSSGHLRRHRLTQHFHDGGEEVLVDDGVLVLGDAERGVLVGDAGQHLDRVAPVFCDQERGVRGDCSRERALLVALGLVAAIEQVAFELGVCGEQALVEHRGDVADGGADDGQRGLDDVGGLGGQHVVSVRLWGMARDIKNCGSLHRGGSSGIGCGQRRRSPTPSPPA